MAASDVNPKEPIAMVGETIQVLQGSPIPDRCLQVGVIAAIPGPKAQLLRLLERNPLPIAPGETEASRGVQFVFTNLSVKGRRVYTKAELDAIRPLAFVVPDRPWGSFARFVEGGLYQGWPSGRLFKVQHRYLVDAHTNLRFDVAKDRAKLPRLFPVFIERWVPPTGARVEEE